MIECPVCENENEELFHDLYFGSEKKATIEVCLKCGVLQGKAQKVASVRWNKEGKPNV